MTQGLLQTFNKFVVFKTAVKHRRYIIAADPATGMTVTSEDPDYSAAVVIDLETGEEMVSYRAHVLPGIFGDDLVQLAMLYNNAEIAVERLGEGGTVIEAITKQNLYGNIYWHKDWWRRDAANSKAVQSCQDLSLSSDGPAAQYKNWTQVCVVTGVSPQTIYFQAIATPVLNRWGRSNRSTLLTPIKGQTATELQVKDSTRTTLCPPLTLAIPFRW
jgi:hypothetical protein